MHSRSGTGRVAAAVVASTLALTGCGAPAAHSSPTTTGDGGAGTSASTSPSTTHVAGPAALEGAVVFVRTGGLAGLDDRVEISPDGRMIVTREGGARRSKLTAQEPAVLAGLLGVLPDTDTDFSPPDRCCDLFTYTVEYRGVSVSTMDTAIPADLLPLVETLVGLIER